MLQDIKISFIGSGVMAEAMIKGLLDKELLPAHNILASDVRPERGEELTQQYGVRVTQDNRQAASAGPLLCQMSSQTASANSVSPRVSSIGRRPGRK